LKIGTPTVDSGGCGPVVGPLVERCRERVVVRRRRPLAGERREGVVADVGSLVHLGPAGHRGLDRRSQPLGLGGHLRLVALGELGQHLAAEQLDRLHDVLVAVPSGLEHEDHLVDAGLLEPPQVLAHLGRRADAAAQAGGVAGRLLGAEPLGPYRRGDRVGVVALRGATVDELVPHVGLRRAVLAEHVEVAE
jgi:hypothetical protein